MVSATRRHTDVPWPLLDTEYTVLLHCSDSCAVDIPSKHGRFRRGASQCGSALRPCALARQVVWPERCCTLLSQLFKQSKTRERAVAEGKGKDAPNPKWNGKQEEDEWIIFMLCRMGGRYFLV